MLAVAALLLTSCSAPESADALVRVDQTGYIVGESKTAYAMGDAGALDGAGYRVVDSSGDVMLEGELGDASTPWNDEYDAVRPIDLTDLDDVGDYRIELTGGVEGRSPEFVIGSGDDVLRPLADLTLTFFQAQRDGADVIPEVMDRKPSHLLDAAATVYETPTYEDGGQTLVGELVPSGLPPWDVSGGWFDAGDFLKFTGTTAYASTAMIVAERDGATASDDLAAEIELGLAWLDRMWDDETQTLGLQVGIGNGNDAVRTDHDVWRLPEDDDANAAPQDDPDYTISHRPIFLAGEAGSSIQPSVAGRVAAAFALASQRAVSQGDEEAATTWLTKAADIYALADTEPAANATAVPAEFYPEDSWQDDLELATVELAIAADAIGDDRARGWLDDSAAWATAYIDSDVRGTLGVGDVSALAHAELAAQDEAVAPLLIDDLRRQLDSGVDAAASDPFGAGVSLVEFDSVPFAFGLIATAGYYERVTGDDGYREFAEQQRAWVFGANAWGSSFMIGAGDTYPQCPEHQVANLADAGPLLGAVVNGPNAAEQLDELNRFATMVPCASDAADGAEWAQFDGRGSRYLDDVGAWQTVEPAIDFTATALLGLSASLLR
ncbi:glycoside hydrolase family 9 protein [Microbacterium phyllosphaerae]